MSASFVVALGLGDQMPLAPRFAAALLRARLERDARVRGVLVSLCLECQQVYGAKDAQGAAGGVSDGLCPGRCEDAYRVRMGLKPKAQA